MLAGVEIIRRAGARIASDDVGAGYAGLLQLVRLRPDMIKVDRALVSRLDTDPAAESVLRPLGDLASQLDGWVLVEGVETQEQPLTSAPPPSPRRTRPEGCSLSSRGDMMSLLQRAVLQVRAK